MFNVGCEQAAKTGLKFSVNIGDTDFLHDDVVNYIQSTLDKYDINPNLLSLEILENYAISHNDKIKEVILDIHNLGIEMNVDDFGINCSNFGQIDSLPINIIKIDGSFIKNLPHCENSKIIVKTIQSFAKDKGIKLVAEFVCNEEVYKKVKELGLDYAQGYYLCEPLPELKE